eukprot:scaffold42955_cov21-Tisochrysis_lutea.AAC.4
MAHFVHAQRHASSRIGVGACLSGEYFCARYAWMTKSLAFFLRRVGLDPCMLCLIGRCMVPCMPGICKGVDEALWMDGCGEW